MFCENCGEKMDDGMQLCPNCGKKLNVVDNKNIGNGYLLTNLSAKLFKLFFEISLWFILICGIIIGGLLEYSRDGIILRGIIWGGIFSFVFMIIFGGLVSLLMNINNNIEKLKKES
jgi:uncharacterized membrane protein YvbJ